MAVYGIIAEYNPFHNGHAYQLAKLRALDPDAEFICVMSGSFTQRGEAAILDKWQRAALAISGGADLVLELPFAFAVRSAQHFASGGTALLDRLGLVDFLSFGSECADAAQLEKAATAAESPEISAKLRTGLHAGLPYAAAMSQAVAALTGMNEAALRQPNTILAIEYLRSLQRLHSPIRPLPIERKAAADHDTTIRQDIASASAIRQELSRPQPDTALLAQALPPASLQALSQAAGLPVMEHLLRPLLLAIYEATPIGLQQIYGIREGIEHKILAAAAKSASLAELAANIRSRRYPLSSIQRLFLHLLLRVSAEEIQRMDASGPLYGRVLAMNAHGCGLLHRCKHTASIPLITKTSQFLTTTAREQPATLTPLQQMLALDTRATALYGLCFERPASPRMDFTTSPIVLPRTGRQ